MELSMLCYAATSGFSTATGEQPGPAPSLTGASRRHREYPPGPIRQQ